MKHIRITLGYMIYWIGYFYTMIILVPAVMLGKFFYKFSKWVMPKDE